MRSGRFEYGVPSVLTFIEYIPIQYRLDYELLIDLIRRQ